jgi:Tol biopolymer transport system component
MPDVKEVYQMVTQQTPPKPDALERQRKRQMRHTLNQRLGAFAVVVAIAGLAFLAVRATAGDGGRPAATSTGTQPSVTVPSTGPSTAPGVPKVDYVLDLNTGVMTPLPDAIIRSLGKRDDTGQYAVSPDGSELAYVGTGDEGTPEIFIAGIDGTGVRQVTGGPAIEWLASPAWSPDGMRIAYAADLTQQVPPTTAGRNLFILDVATGRSTQITDGTSNLGSGIQFTPDGSSILYTGGTDQVPQLLTVPVAGGKSTLLFPLPAYLEDSGNGSLSPDGSLVTFQGSGWTFDGKTTPPGTVGHCGPCRWVARADGTDRRIIPGYQSNPAGTWSPDGSRIVDLACRGIIENEENCSAPSRITVVDIATGKATQVALGNGAIWLDDHTLLVEV